MPRPFSRVKTSLLGLSTYSRVDLTSRCLSTHLAPPPRFRPTLLPRICLPIQTRSTRTYKTVEQARSKYAVGPFSITALVLFLGTGGFLWWYFDHEKKRIERKRIAEASKGIGKPSVGGAFELVDHHGNFFSSDQLKGRYSLFYFGFTHCPDICPEELDKMARIVDLIEEQRPGAITPVFVTCDPARDSPDIIKGYLAEFHPKFIGLTGSYEAIKSMCKAFRVYFSTPQNVEPGKDYLVDHSIYFFLMDPTLQFVEALGRQHSPDQGAKLILDHMKDWKAELKSHNDLTIPVKRP